MKAKPAYDAADPRSIEAHAKALEGRSLSRLYGRSASERRVRGKGGLGSMVESIHFGYSPNSASRPDFHRAGVELKTSPLRDGKRGKRSVKERLVLNIINFKDAARESDFKESAFWKKNESLLLMFYLWKKGVPLEDLVFDLTGIWEYPEADLAIIRDDWRKIVDKIKQDQAHLLSERDTLYLAACTKGSDSTELRDQVAGPPAKQRAYALKRSYMDLVYHEMSGRAARKGARSIAEPLGRRRDESFEDAVVRRLTSFKGRSEPDIKAHLKLEYDPKAKNKLNLVAKGILGSPTSEIEEFLKADVQMKTVRLNHDGTLSEHMSFRQIDYAELLKHRWEESTFHDELNRRLLFVVFREDSEGVAVLQGAFFFGMPEEHFKEASKVWVKARAVLRAKTQPYEFPGADQNAVAHVRPKARNRNDKAKMPWGHAIPKKAFWLNKDYILALVREQIGI